MPAPKRMRGPLYYIIVILHKRKGGGEVVPLVHHEANLSQEMI